METLFGTINERGEVTETMRVDVNSLPSSDPFAFAYGIISGKQFRKMKEEERNRFYSHTYERIHGSKYRELAQEYLRGFLLGFMGILVKEGTKIRKGTEMNYSHLSNNLLK